MKHPTWNSSKIIKSNLNIYNALKYKNCPLQNLPRFYYYLYKFVILGNSEKQLAQKIYN
jgi:hypothetical protein